jgi:hypothetical protein
MQTRIRKPPGPVVVGVLAALAGAMALWRLGIEEERAWMRSYDGPLLGEWIAGETDEQPQAVEAGQTTQAIGARRRWVATNERRVPGAARVAQLG